MEQEAKDNPTRSTLQTILNYIFEVDDTYKKSAPGVLNKIKSDRTNAKQATQQMKLNATLVTFDEFDSDRLEALDIFQVRLLFESGKLSQKKMNLTEEEIRNMMGRMFLDNSNRVSRKEFPKFSDFLDKTSIEVEVCYEHQSLTVLLIILAIKTFSKHIFNTKFRQCR